MSTNNTKLSKLYQITIKCRIPLKYIKLLPFQGLLKYTNLCFSV
jgi:hypothetical protein